MVKEKPAPENEEPEEADSKQAEAAAVKEEGEDKEKKDSETLEAQEKPSQPELMSLAVAPKVCVYCMRCLLFKWVMDDYLGEEIFWPRLQWPKG